MIQVRGISKAFGPKQVLAGITCEIKRGDTTVIMGPSGAGKSVFAKILVGLVRPDGGEVFVDGLEITHLPERELFRMRRKIGMCFQDGALFNSMSVGDNVAFPLRKHTKLPEREIRRIVAHKLEGVGLPGLEGASPAQLSGGMRKRVGIARAIALDPELLIFDEPTSGLDPVMSDAIDQLIVGMKGTCTIVAISHDVTSTQAIADRIGMIHDGRLVAFGDAEAVRRSTDSIVRQFFAREGRIGHASTT